MRKRLVTILLLIILSASYHSIVLSANETAYKEGWEEYQLKRIYQSKNVFAKRIDEVLPEPQASLLNGIIFGIKGTMPQDFFTDLKTSGVVHIIALSGTNISILISAAFGLLTPILGRRKAAILAILSIIIFIWFVGPSPSVVRAGIMGILALLAAYFGRQYLGVLSLILACLIMIIVSPMVIKDIGFQLSVAATLGIMLIGTSSHSKNRGDPSTRPASRRGSLRMTIRSIFRAVENNLKVTLAAQAFTLPIIIVNFGELSIISPLTNILVAPAVPIITNVGLLTAIIVVLVRPIGVILLWALWVLLSYFVAVVKLTSVVPLASVKMPKIGWEAGIIYYLIISVLYFRKKVKITL